MRYFIDTIAQPVEETVEDLIQAGFIFAILNRTEVLFEGPVEDEEVRIYGLICID